MPILDNVWSIKRSEPGHFDSPAELANLPVLQQVDSCTTVASALSSAQPPYGPDDIDDFDWWYECEFDAKNGAGSSFLIFEGLATLAEVWLNGNKILTSSNMFVTHTVDVTAFTSDKCLLTIVFRSVASSLAQKRPRPRWKTNLVDHQQLRWIRTTLLGRIPGWTPRVRAIGPWKNIRFEQDEPLLDEYRVLAGIDGNGGTVSVNASIRSKAGVESATLEIDGLSFALDVETVGDVYNVSGRARLEEVTRWYPHTHGTPFLYEYRLIISTRNQQTTLKSGKVGFRQIELLDDSSSFSFSVNGEQVFCRGACWTTANIESLHAERDQLKGFLQIAADSGANMIRVGGTMVYESDDFYDLCDELGIMVWQDFMFASMDYPIDDKTFRDSIETEIRQQTGRISSHASVVAFCGNSEVEQQAAMFGRSAKDYCSDLFYRTIPELLDELETQQPYIASSPTGGALPFHNGSGVSHYFGIGAYKRPVSDASNTRLLFASECLGFSNTPSDELLRGEFGSLSPVTHTPRWKAGVPRDTGPGWDFEDIRDFYYQELFGDNPVEDRYADNSTYLARSACTTGEVMRRAYAQWRSSENACNGALVWNMVDIVPGAGWGFIDTYGNRKPVFYYLKRAWSPRSVSLIDAGLDGLQASVHNDSPDKLYAKLAVSVLRQSHIRLASNEIELELDPREQRQYSVDEIIGQFLDTTYSYRFGPLGHDVVVVTLTTNDGASMSDAFFPGGYALAKLAAPQVSYQLRASGDAILIQLACDSFLQDVALQAAGFEFSDNFFHLAPGTTKTVTAKAKTNVGKDFRGTLSALNLASSFPLKAN